MALKGNNHGIEIEPPPRIAPAGRGSASQLMSFRLGRGERIELGFACMCEGRYVWAQLASIWVIRTCA